MRHPDLRSAGVALAVALDEYRDAEDTMVVGIVRGGIPAAMTVADMLGLPCELALRRPVLKRKDTEWVMAFAGAVSIAGTLVLDPELETRNSPPVSGEDFAVEQAIREFAARVLVCRSDRAPISIRGSRVILVDNGVRTGGTMRATILAARRLGAGEIVAATPVSDAGGLAVISSLADRVVSLATPPAFGNVALWYERFDVPSDEEVGRQFRKRTA